VRGHSTSLPILFFFPSNEFSKHHYFQVTMVRIPVSSDPYIAHECKCRTFAFSCELIRGLLAYPDRIRPEISPSHSLTADSSIVSTSKSCTSPRGQCLCCSAGLFLIFHVFLFFRPFLREFNLACEGLARLDPIG
jgi:hypothetical protein